MHPKANKVAEIWYGVAILVARALAQWRGAAWRRQVQSEFSITSIERDEIDEYVAAATCAALLITWPISASFIYVSRVASACKELPGWVVVIVLFAVLGVEILVERIPGKWLRGSHKKWYVLGLVTFADLVAFLAAFVTPTGLCK